VLTDVNEEGPIWPSCLARARQGFAGLEAGPAVLRRGLTLGLPGRTAPGLRSSVGALPVPDNHIFDHRPAGTFNTPHFSRKHVID